MMSAVLHACDSWKNTVHSSTTCVAEGLRFIVLYGFPMNTAVSIVSEAMNRVQLRFFSRILKFPIMREVS